MFMFIAVTLAKPRLLQKSVARPGREYPGFFLSLALTCLVILAASLPVSPST